MRLPLAPRLFQCFRGLCEPEGAWLNIINAITSGDTRREFKERKFVEDLLHWTIYSEAYFRYFMISITWNGETPTNPSPEIKKVVLQNLGAS